MTCDSLCLYGNLADGWTGGDETEKFATRQITMHDGGDLLPSNSAMQRLRGVLIC